MCISEPSSFKVAKHWPSYLLLIVCFQIRFFPGASLQPAKATNQLLERQERSNICAGLTTMPPCSATPWKPLRTATVREVCVNNKSLPKLYVLGAQKSGTSSLATDLSCTGIQPVPGSDDKEFHFFDGHSKWRGLSGERKFWLQWLPPCGLGAKIRGVETSNARVMADFTPNNLRMVPGETPYSGIEINVPSVLKHFYPAWASKELVFVMMIREPLSRMQSAWYAARECGDFKAICKDDCRAPSFQDALKRALQNAQLEPPLYTEWIWTSMYGRHLENWLQHFDATQIYVLPYREYSQGDADSVCRDISRMLKFDIDCDSQGKGVTHAWASGHKPLVEDMTPQLNATFHDVMEKETTMLVRLLAKAHRMGLGLSNYQGQTGSEEHIRRWLETRW